MSRTWCPGDCAMHHACACPDKLDRHPAGNVADVRISDRPATPAESRRLEDELVAIIADVLERRRTIRA